MLMQDIVFLKSALEAARAQNGGLVTESESLTQDRQMMVELWAQRERSSFTFMLQMGMILAVIAAGGFVGAAVAFKHDGPGVLFVLAMAVCFLGVVLFLAKLIRRC